MSRAIVIESRAGCRRHNHENRVALAAGLEPEDDCHGCLVDAISALRRTNAALAGWLAKYEPAPDLLAIARGTGSVLSDPGEETRLSMLTNGELANRCDESAREEYSKACPHPEATLGLRGLPELLMHAADRMRSDAHELQVLRDRLNDPLPGEGAEK